MFDLNDHEQLIHPGGRYRSSCPREFEKLALEVLKWMRDFGELEVHRTQDVIQISVDEELGFSVIVMLESVDVRLSVIEWTCGAYEPALTSRSWKKLSAKKARTLSGAEWVDMFQAASQARKNQQKRCRLCNEKFVPERMHSKDVCQGCAEQQLDIVH